MAESLCQPITAQVAARREELAPDIHEAWDRFSDAVFTAGAYAHSAIALNAIGPHIHTGDAEQQAYPSGGQA